MPINSPAAYSLDALLLPVLILVSLLVHASQRARVRRRPLRLGRLVRAAAIGLIVAVVVGQPAAPGSMALAAAPSSNQIQITDNGFQPASLTSKPGESLHWTNVSSATRSVVASSGLFDSGPIPPGGGFSIALAVPGTHAYTSPGAPGFVGEIKIVFAGLTGPGTDLASQHIPTLAFPLSRAGDMARHPHLGVVASRTRLMVGFVASATVAQANAALLTAGVTIEGGIPQFGLLLVTAPDTADFSALDIAAASLRVQPAVEFAALSPRGTTDQTPAVAEDRTRKDSNPWEWDVKFVNGQPRGTGGNWGLEASRFPQSWNWNEAIKKKSALIRTGIVDQGFGSHADLSTVIYEAPCTTVIAGFGEKCALNIAVDHGTHVAGIIGADYDNSSSSPLRTIGVSGGNPVARIHAYPWGFSGDGGFDETYEIFGLIFDGIESKRLLGMRVISFSVGMELQTAAQLNQPDGWWAEHPQPTCGPSEKDDDQPGSNQWCNPNNDDKWLLHALHEGRLARSVAMRAAGLEVLIVNSAGNDTSTWCVSGPVVPPAVCTAGFISVRAANSSPFAWATDNWESGSVRPLAVESIDATLARAGSSNGNGQIAAPGVGILSTVRGNSYATLSGTSMAAPLVSALVGYLLAFNPDLSAEHARQQVINFAIPTTTSSPRIDAFATLLAQDAAARALVDVNDFDSADGNLRIRLGPENQELAVVEASKGGYRTAMDGKVDMRDFRRFRDAWLQTCMDAYVHTGLQMVECPAVGGIVLNGPDTHLKKDLNFDGCVEVGDRTACPQDENVYPRFDFNGDGEILLNVAIPVALKPDGRPASNRAEMTPMTDLQVLQSQWDVLPTATEGWHASDLDKLMVSGDIEIHANDLFASHGEDVSEVQVTVRRKGTGELLPARTISNADETIVVTAPIEGESTTYQVTGSAKSGTTDIDSLVRDVVLKPGEDKRVDLCAAHLLLDSNRSSLTADGSSKASLTARVTVCQDATVTGQTVRFSVEPAGIGHASLSPATAVTDNLGKATSVLTAGTLITPQTYIVTASVLLPSGRTLSAKTEIGTTPKVKIAYVWRETIQEWREDGSTRWPTPLDAATPDCTVEGVVNYCLDQSSVQFDPANPPVALKRSGVLSSTGSTVKLSEQADPGVNQSQVSWTRSIKPLTGPTQTCTGSAHGTWNVAASDLTRYQDYDLFGKVAVEDDPEGVTLRGLRNVAELGYQQELLEQVPNVGCGQVIPTELHAARPEFMLVPRGDGSALQFAEDTFQPLVFPRASDGSLRPYQYCGPSIEVDLTSRPGYLLRATSEWLAGGSNVTRKPNYVAGDRPMPVGPGKLKVQYAFAAVAVYGEQTPAVALPDCSVVQPPAADFSFTPSIGGDEGRVIRFNDLSTGATNVTWQWDFGDGASPRPQPCATSDRNTCHLFQDNGTFAVTLTVTDALGVTNSKTRQVRVDNLPPEAQMADVTAEENKPITAQFSVWDPGWKDQDTLSTRLHVNSTNPVLPDFVETMAAGTKILTLPALPVGTYRMTLTVTDKDGASTTIRATLEVFRAAEVPLPAGPTAPVATCDATVSLDSEEAAFLGLLNTYRKQNGLRPIEGISPTLSRSADRHSNDMAAKVFFSHTGSDGSTPATRARDAGYVYSNSENLHLDSVGTALSALNGWKSSKTGHNENMLNPIWRAAGVSRVRASNGNWYFTNTFGDVLDCPAVNTARAVDVDDAPSYFMAGVHGLTELRLPMAAVAAPAALLAPILSLGNAPLEQAALYPPVPAVMVSPVQPIARQPVTFVNRSRSSSGVALAAALSFGDGGPTVALGPDASVEHTFADVGTFGISLTASDSGGTLAVVRELDVSVPTGDFTLVTSPTSQVLAPGNTTAFLVTVGSVRGFNTPVTLSISGLPAGVTASLSPPVVTPSGISRLTLTAAANVAVGSAQITITGTAGGVSHSTSNTLQVDFGLIPICYGAVAGRVLDKSTGLPLSGIRISAFSSPVVTDAQGRFAIDGIGLGPDNTPISFQVFAPLSAAYQSGFVFTQVGCGAVPEVELQLEPRRYGTLSGRVTVGAADPNDLSTGRHITDTGVPLEAASIEISSAAAVSSASAGVDGSWRSDSVQLQPAALSENVFVAIRAPSYWPILAQRSLVAGQDSVVPTAALVRQCTARLSGRLLFADTRQPVANYEVQASAGWIEAPPNLANGNYGYTAETDALGNFVFAQVFLNHNNASAIFRLDTRGVAPATYLNNSVTGIVVPTCGSDVSGVEVLLPREAGPNFGAVSGHVYDRDTGEPLAGARIQIAPADGDLLTDAQGAFSIPSVNVGIGAQTSMQQSLYATRADYYGDGGAASITVRANETTVHDFRLVRTRFGRIQGTVRDAASHLPLAGAQVYFGGPQTTGPDGKFISGPLLLQYPPQSVPYNFTVSALPPLPYWNELGLGTLTPDETTTADVDLVRVCQGATLTGTVVNALTQQALEGATVQWGSLPFQRTLTDAQGKYVLTNVPVSYKNGPNEIGLQATKAGFNPQSKTLTVFCGATIVTDFGRPATAFSTIEGHVTNALTGLPFAGAFVGSEYGGSARTDTSGFYRLTDVPLGAGDAARGWQITAVPLVFAQLTLSATVRANESTTLDFAFGAVINRTLTFTAQGLPLTTAWVPTVNGSPAAPTGPLSFTLSLPQDSAVVFSAPAEVTGTTGTRYVLQGWRRGDGTSVTSPVVANGDETYRAIYAPQYLLSVVASPSAAATSTSPAGAGWFDEGAVATITADAVVNLASTRYEFHQWSGDASGTLSSASVVMAGGPKTAVAGYDFLADLSVTITNSADPVGIGDLVVYGITVANNGPSTVPGFVTTIEPPSDVTVVGTSLCAFARPMICTFTDSIGMGQSLQYTVAVRPLHGGTLTLSASVTSEAKEQNLLNNSATQQTQVQETATQTPTASPTVTNTSTPTASPTATSTATPTASPTATSTATPTQTSTSTSTPTPTATRAPTGPDLALTKSHLGAFTVGKVGSYTFTVTNVGGSATSGAMTLTDSLPTGLSYASTTGTGWSCSAAGVTVTCTTSALLAAGATSSFGLTVNVAASAMPSVTNTARVDATGDTDPSNNSDDDPTAVNAAQPVDSTRPSCALTGSGTDTLGRKFLQVTVQDTGSGLRTIVPTKAINLSVGWPGFAQGATSAVVVTGAKINQSLTSQLELNVTDVAGNVSVCDPILTTLDIGPRGRSEPQTLTQVAQSERIVTLRNGPREHAVVQIMVNGRRFVVTLRRGEERSVDIGVALRPGEVNRLRLVALGIPGSSVEVMVWDGDGQHVGRRDWLPIRPDWRRLLDRTRDSELSEGG